MGLRRTQAADQSHIAGAGYQFLHALRLSRRNRAAFWCDRVVTPALVVVSRRRPLPVLRDPTVGKKPLDDRVQSARRKLHLARTLLLHIFEDRVAVLVGISEG